MRVNKKFTIKTSTHKIQVKKFFDFDGIGQETIITPLKLKRTPKKPTPVEETV